MSGWWHRTPFPRELRSSIPLNCNSIPRYLSLALKFLDAKLDYQSSIMISGNYMYTDAQQLKNYTYMPSAVFAFTKIAF